MKKFFFIGLLVFVVFFTAATIIWFSYDKNKYGTCLLYTSDAADE
ncbi:hypothetical protein JMUB7551_28780 [Staphylococcus aureus]